MLIILNILRRYAVKTLIYSSIIIFAVGLVIFTRETSAAAADGVSLCLEVLLPSLFPFFVISSMAVQTGLAEYIGRFFEAPMRLLFGVPGACAPAFILGIIGGYPVGAKTALTLYQNRLCSKTEAERLLAFCNNCGPAFILGTVGSAVFGDMRVGILLYASHILASIAVGIIFRFYHRERNAPSSISRNSGIYRGGCAREVLGFRQAFLSSVSSAIASIINISAFVIFFAVTIRLLCLMEIIPSGASLLARFMLPQSLDAHFAERILSGFLEVTTGIYGFIGTAYVLNARIAASAFMLGWAGLSVHCQVLSFIDSSDLSPMPYIVGKALHGILAAIFAFVGTSIFVFDTQASSAFAQGPSFLARFTPYHSFFSALLAAIIIWGGSAVICKIFYCKKSKKHV